MGGRNTHIRLGASLANASREGTWEERREEKGVKEGVARIKKGKGDVGGIGEGVSEQERERVRKIKLRRVGEKNTVRETQR